jgi:glutathione S-transferase
MPKRPEPVGDTRHVVYPKGRPGSAAVRDDRRGSNAATRMVPECQARFNQDANVPAKGLVTMELFHISGSSSFAAHCALEEAGCGYELVAVDPKDRSRPPDLRDVNPLGVVPALRDGTVCVYETGAVLMYLADRYPESRLAPASGDRARGEWYRWMVWISNTFHPAWKGVFVPARVTTDEAGHDGVRARSREALTDAGTYLERELAGKDWCLGENFSVADLYAYMLVGWANYFPDLPIGGPVVSAHFARVGDRPCVARVREAENLDERLLRRG